MTRTWTAPDEPGADVTHVRDSLGVLWRRDDDLWWGNIGHDYEVHRSWWELLRRGPLTDDSVLKLTNEDLTLMFELADEDDNDQD